MKSVQRKFGGMMKRSADDADAAACLAEFRSVEGMLDTLIKDLKLYRSQWEEILRYQFDLATALYELYKPIDPTQDPEQRHQPAQTPPRFMQKAHTLQKEYSDLRNDLNSELDLISTRLIQPTEHAKLQIKPLHKTIKHRENMKLDYERYLSRAEHVRNKETRSVKEENALAIHEENLAQSRIDYETADEQVRSTLPPVSAAVLNILPLLAASQVMVTSTLVGQIYTILDGWCRRMGLPSPAPSDDMIIAHWDREYTPLRQEMESGFKVLSSGKAVNQSMTLQEKSSTMTGLGIRDKISHRKVSGPGRAGTSPQRPMITSGRSSSTQLQALPAPTPSDRASTYSASNYGDNDDEPGPPQPPRPGFGGKSYSSSSNYGSPPQINLNNKPQIPSQSKPRIPSSSNLPSQGANTALTHRGSFNADKLQAVPSAATFRPAPSYLSPQNSYQGSGSNGHSGSSGGSTPPSRYGTPNGAVSQPGYSTSPSPYGLAPTTSHGDYFSAQQRRPSQSSLASSAASVIAGKKKPPPPPAPKPKRLGSQQDQYVVALFDFDAQGPGDLGFREGERIKVVKKTGSQDDWWEGEGRGGAVGSFPANYVRKDGWV